MVESSTRSVRYATAGLAALAALALGAAAACSSSQDATPGRVCTPGNYVYCRCVDRSEGTKLCHADGQGFDACQCDGVGGGIDPGGYDPDAGLGSGPLMPVDPGPPPSGPSIDNLCTGKLGIVAGSNADLDAYVATYAGGGVFTVSKSTGPGLRGRVQVLPVNGSLVAVYLSRFSLIAWTKLAAGTWSAPISVGSAQAVSDSAATLHNGLLRLVYLGQDASYHMGTYGGSGWDDATALAGASADAGAAIGGKSPPAVATAGSSMALLFTAQDGSLYRELFSGSWSSFTKMASDAYSVPPAVVGLEGSGAKDMLAVYSDASLTLRAMTRESSNKAWNTAVVVDTAAESIEMSLAPLPSGGALLVYLASNDKPYVSVWSPGSGFSAPAELVPGKNPELAAAPSLARGQCGSELTLAYAEKNGGAVKVMRYAAAAWTGPFDVGGIANASWVGVGEMP